MIKKKITYFRNPQLATIKDNKAMWNLPSTRRFGYRNLHKINRYGLLFRSDLILKLVTKKNKKIGRNFLVKKMINQKFFCSLILGNGQKILYEKYAKDFSKINLKQ